MKILLQEHRLHKSNIFQITGLTQEAMIEIRNNHRNNAIGLS